MAADFLLARIEHSSKLFSGFQTRQQGGNASRSNRRQSATREPGLDGQTLAAFCATCIDHSATAFGFHAHEETVCAGAASFGRLVCTFHDAFVQERKKAVCTDLQQVEMTSLSYAQAEPTIIADFAPVKYAAFLVLIRIWPRYCQLFRMNGGWRQP
jgi:hypothetical protein